MATLAEIRRLLFDETAPYVWSDALINDVLVEEANKYRAAAKLIRAYTALMMRSPLSYRMTDGKQFDRVNLAQLRELADSYDEMATQGGAMATVDGKFGTDVAGRDVTEFEDET